MSDHRSQLPWLAAVLLLLSGAVHTASGVTTVSLCITVDNPTINVIEGMSPNIGDVFTSTSVYLNFEGFGMELMSVLFDQLLEYNYTVTLLDGFSHSIYLNRIYQCDISVGSFFKAYSREQCTVCPLPPVGFNTSAAANEDGWETYACCIEFSHTFFPGGWSLMALEQTNPEINVLAIIGQKPIVQAACYAVLLTLAIAHVMWLLERTVFYDVAKIPKPFLFAPKYLDGIRDGAWFAGTTVLNNALHNKMFFTGVGRVVATAWVAFGMFLTAFVTSIFSSTLTTQSLNTISIHDVSDLAGKSVCMQEGFYDIFFTSAFPNVLVTKILVAEPEDCYPLVLDGTVTAVFSIRETFISYFSTGQGAGLIVTPVVAAQDYAIVWGQNFPYYADVNTAILNYLEGISATSPAYQTSKQHWFGGDASAYVSGGAGTKRADHWNWPLIICTIVVVSLYLLLQLIVVVGTWVAKRRITHVREGDTSMKGRSIEFLAKAASSLASALSTKVEQGVASTSARLDSAMLGDDIGLVGNGSMSHNRGGSGSGIPGSPSFFKGGAVAPGDGEGSQHGGGSTHGGNSLGGVRRPPVGPAQQDAAQDKTEYIVSEVSRRVTDMLMKGPLGMQVQDCIQEESAHGANNMRMTRAESLAQSPRAPTRSINGATPTDSRLVI